MPVFLLAKIQRGWPHTAWLPPLLHDQCDETTHQLESPEAFYLSPVLIHIWVSDPGLGLHASFFDSSKESCMVTFGLVRINLGERCNGSIERIPVPQVAADLCRVAGARVRSRQGRRTQLDVRSKQHRVHPLDLRRELHVAQLSCIDVHAIESRPAKEDIA